MPSPSEGRPSRDWRLYAQDMDRFAHRAVGYCAELDRGQFEANNLMQDAVLRNLELIGEAATRIPEDVRLAHPEIPWRQIIAMRNQLIHAYLGIDLDVVWDVVQVELPLLIQQLKVVIG
jgi:uncharacterized protein with HEPN domain